MPRKFTVKLPENERVVATYGFDPFLGFFVTTRQSDGLHEYDALRTGYEGLDGALGFLARFGFFSEEDVAVAAHRLRDFLPEDIEDPDVARAAAVIVNLRRAASA